MNFFFEQLKGTRIGKRVETVVVSSVQFRITNEKLNFLRSAILSSFDFIAYLIYSKIEIERILLGLCNCPPTPAVE